MNYWDIINFRVLSKELSIVSDNGITYWPVGQSVLINMLIDKAEQIKTAIWPSIIQNQFQHILH